MVLAAAVIGGAVLVLTYRHAWSPGTDAEAPGAGAPTSAAKAPAIFWDTVGAPPAVVTIGGKEAVLGRLRNIGTDNELSVAAFDATTLTMLWRVGPLGAYTDGYRSTCFAESGGHVVITDFHSVAHVVDLATGKEQRRATLSDKVSAICGVPPTGMWLEQVDKRSVLLDVTTGSVTEAARPPTCPQSEPWGTRTKNVKVDLPGFASRRQLVADHAIVASGVKSPGTPTPIVVGLDPQTHAVLWQTPLPTVDLATVRDENRAPCAHGDRFVSAYGVGPKQLRVTALDAVTGARQWDVALRPILAVDLIQTLVCSETRVYVVRMDSVDVLDARSGKAVGTIGKEPYEDEFKR